MKRSPLRKVNRQRKAREFVRTYGSADRCDFIRRLPCIVLGCQNKPCDNAHVGDKGTTGAHYKADAEWTVPLCSLTHHPEYHQIGRESFAAKYKLDLAYHARMTDLTWSLANEDAT